MLKFEWNEDKAAINLRKHDVSFDEAGTVFLDPLAVTYPDPDHAEDGDREITIGYSTKERLLFVSHAQRGDRLRIIGARQASRRERRQHEEGTSEEQGFQRTRNANCQGGG